MRVLSDACCSGGEACGLTWSVRVLSDACCSGGEACGLTWSVRVLSEACCSRGDACVRKIALSVKRERVFFYKRRYIYSASSKHYGISQVNSTHSRLRRNQCMV